MTKAELFSTVGYAEATLIVQAVKVADHFRLNCPEEFKAAFGAMTWLDIQEIAADLEIEE